MDKREAIVSSARLLFMQRGLEAVKIEEIAAAAGVSRMTVYANYPDKTALFEAVVELQTAEIRDAFSGLHTGDGSIETVLTHFGNALLSFLLNPEIMRFDEILSAEMSRHPDLGQRFYTAGPARMWQTLAALIQQAADKGELRTNDTRRAAEDLIALWLGMVPLRHRFNDLTAMTDAEIAERVKHGITVFMGIYGRT